MRWSGTYMQGARRDELERWIFSRQISRPWPSCPYVNVCLLSTWRRSFHRTSLSKRRQKKRKERYHYYIYKKDWSWSKESCCPTWNPSTAGVPGWMSWTVISQSINIYQITGERKNGKRWRQKIARYCMYLPCIMNHDAAAAAPRVSRNVCSYLLCTIS